MASAQMAGTSSTRQGPWEKIMCGPSGQLHPGYFTAVEKMFPSNISFCKRRLWFCTLLICKSEWRYETLTKIRIMETDT